MKEQQDSLEALKKEFSRFKLMLGQTQQARSKCAQNATFFDMITDIKSSTPYRQQQESKDVLEYIHGGEEGAMFDAWDLIAAYASKTMDKLITSYQRGK